jgi:hypothetical protein
MKFRKIFESFYNDMERNKKILVRTKESEYGKYGLTREEIIRELISSTGSFVEFNSSSELVNLIKRNLKSYMKDFDLNKKVFKIMFTRFMGLEVLYTGRDTISIPWEQISDKYLIDLYKHFEMK